MANAFGEWASVFYDQGLVPLPLGEGKKGKIPFFNDWQLYTRNRYNSELLSNYVSKYATRNIGLATGTLVNNDLQLIAIDIDHPDFVEAAERALPFTLSGKRGRKGITWFALAPRDLPNKKLQLKGGMIIELLANGNQTVIPPSIHPDTGSPYTWVGIPLHEINLLDLPVVTNSFMLEMRSIINGNGQYFIGGRLDSDEDVAGINNMEWRGVGGGGSTYDSRLRCIAHMVSTGWEDDEIITRIKRSQKEAVENAGEEFDWPDCEREIQQQINDAKKKGFGDSKPGTRSKIPAERQWAEWLKTQYDFPVCYADKVFAYMEKDPEEPGGYFADVPIKTLDSKIARTFEMATKPKIRTAVDTFCSLTYEEKFGKKGEDYICLNNGTLKVSTMRFVDASPEHQLFYKLNVDWDPSASCATYDDFVDWVFGGDPKSIQVWNEFCGLSLVDNMSYQKAMFLLGEGANGKSTLSNLLVKIHHHSVISNVPITELDDERKVTSLVGKLLNISTEQSRISSITDNIFKLIVGGDPIVIRRLYAEAENNVYLKVRFLSLANELPPLSDNSEAMRRRLIILQCPNTVTEGNRDTGLLDKLVAEKSGILNTWVKALNTLNARGHFDLPDTSNRMVDEYTSSGDTALSWSKDRTIQDNTTAFPINFAYLDFTEYTKMCGVRFIMNRYSWVSRMKRLGFKVWEVDLPDSGPTMVIGLKLKTPAPSVRSSEL